MAESIIPNTLNEQIATVNEQINNSRVQLSLNTSTWSTNKTYAFKLGGMAIVSFFVNGTPSNGKTIVTGCPRPVNDSVAYTASGSSPSVVSVNANGVLYISSAGTGTYIGGTIVYPIT